MSPSPDPREQPVAPHTSEGIASGTCFTAEEVARLCALRRHFQAHPDHGDADAAVRRLEFARWLVQHGRLSEGSVSVDRRQTFLG